MAIIQGTSVSYPTSYSTSGSSINGSKYKNAIGKGSDTSAVSGNDYVNSSGSTAVIAYSFAFDIPANATIDSVECTVKGHCENTSRSTATLQLYAGSTAKGSSTKFSSTSAQTLTLTTGTWTREEIDNMALHFTIGYYGGLVNGATVTVHYSYDAVTHDITSSTTVGTIEPDGITTLLEGENYTLAIHNEGAEFVVKDNDTDVTSQLVEKEPSSGGTLSFVPASYTTSGSISGTSYQSAVGNGSDTSESSSGNNYASGGQSATAHIDYAFDISGIPSDATITAITCTVKGRAESETIDDTQYSKVVLCLNGTEISGEVTFTSTSDSVITVTATTMPSLSDAPNIVLRHMIAYYGGNVIGATLNIEYTVPTTGYNYFVYTLTNVTADHVIVVSEANKYIYVKVNGSWVRAAIPNQRTKISGAIKKIKEIYAKVDDSWHLAGD